MVTCWKRADGSICRFSAYAYDSDWSDVGGIYIFAAHLPGGDWNPLYIGKTESFKARIPLHEKWAWAVMLGATGVLACAVTAPTVRASIEIEMVARLKPPLNDHQRWNPLENRTRQRS